MTVLMQLFTAILVLSLIVGLLRVVAGPSQLDRILSVQLFGTTSVAVLLLLAVITQQPALFNVALVLALFAPMILIVLVRLRKGVK